MMSQSFSDDPKITFALIKLADLLKEQQQNPDLDFEDITSHKDDVLARYQPIFAPGHIARLTKTDFESFLLIRNNHHWDSIHRVGKYMTEDMELLRKAISILVDENLPIQDRLNELRPERYWGAHSMVSHMGMPVLTAILQVVFPDKYGVWNNTSDKGLKKVKLWDKRWDSQPAGNTYLEMNAIYLFLSRSLNIDLWTLDALWWVIRK